MGEKPTEDQEAIDKDKEKESGSAALHGMMADLSSKSEVGH